MPRKYDLPLQKVNVRLYKGDFERLQHACPAIGANAAIREIVRDYLRKVDEGARKPTERVA